MAEIVWNGLGLTTPPGWEPVAIERDGLTLAIGGAPVCELKWNCVVGSFSFDRHLKRLTRGNKGAALHGVEDGETPPAWAAALESLADSGFRARSFIWRSGQGRGIGAALHTPGTGLAVLVQFFIGAESGETVAAEVLSTLRDYTAGQTAPWAMFGLSGRIPSTFVLDTFSFRPGHYRVAWWRPRSGKRAGKLPPGKGPGTHLVFERFAPASVLLKGTALETWVADNVDNAPVPASRTQGFPVSWDAMLKSSMLRRMLRREIRSRGRVWTTGEGNAILSVVAHGMVPVPESVFNDVCEGYGLVQEEAV